MSAAATPQYFNATAHLLPISPTSSSPLSFCYSGTKAYIIAPTLLLYIDADQADQTEISVT